MDRPTFEVALALVRQGERWLVARRHADTHLGGLWEFPGGKRNSDEKPEAAALRELREECGVEAMAERLLDAVVYEDDTRRVVLTPVICRWEAGQPRPIASSECLWATLAELQKLDMPPVNAEILQQMRRAT